jgi:hypothetical protein
MAVSMARFGSVRIVCNITPAENVCQYSQNPTTFAPKGQIGLLPSTLSFFQGSSSEAPTRWVVGPSDRTSLARWLSFVGVRAAAAPQMTPHRRDGQRRTGTTCYSDQCVAVGNRRDQQRSVVTVEVPAGGQTAHRYRCDRQWHSFRLGGFACVQKSSHAARSLICSVEGAQDRNDTSCVCTCAT